MEYNFISGLNRLIENGCYELPKPKKRNSKNLETNPILIEVKDYNGNDIEGTIPIYKSTVDKWITLLNKGKKGLQSDYIPRWDIIYTLQLDMFSKSGSNGTKDTTCFSLEQLFTGINIYTYKSSEIYAHRHLNKYLNEENINFIKGLDSSTKAMLELLLQSSFFQDILSAISDYKYHDGTIFIDARNIHLSNINNAEKAKQLGIISINKIQNANNLFKTVDNLLSNNLVNYKDSSLSLNMHKEPYNSFHPFNFKNGLDRCMKQYNYSISHLARKLTKSESTVRSWTTDNNSIPSLDTIKELCGIFNCNIDYLFAITECRHQISYSIMDYMKFRDIETSDLFIDKNYENFHTFNLLLKYSKNELISIVKKLLCLFQLQLGNNVLSKSYSGCNIGTSDCKKALFEYLVNKDIVFNHIRYKIFRSNYKINPLKLYGNNPDDEDMAKYKTSNLLLNKDNKAVSIFDFIDQEYIDVLEEDIISSIKAEFRSIITQYVEHLPLLTDELALNNTMHTLIDDKYNFYTYNPFVKYPIDSNYYTDDGTYLESYKPFNPMDIDSEPDSGYYCDIDEDGYVLDNTPLSGCFNFITEEFDINKFNEKYNGKQIKELEGCYDENGDFNLDKYFEKENKEFWEEQARLEEDYAIYENQYYNPQFYNYFNDDDKTLQNISDFDLDRLKSLTEKETSNDSTNNSISTIDEKEDSFTESEPSINNNEYDPDDVPF